MRSLVFPPGWETDLLLSQVDTKSAKLAPNVPMQKINIPTCGRIGFMMSCKVVLVFVGKVCSRGASLKDSCKWTQSVTSNLA